MIAGSTSLAARGRRRGSASARREDATAVGEGHARGLESCSDRVEIGVPRRGRALLEPEDRLTVDTRSFGKLDKRPVQRRPRHPALNRLQVGDGYKAVP